MTLHFTIPGEPVSKARARIVPQMKCRACGIFTVRQTCHRCGSDDLKYVRSIPYTPKETRMFENQVASTAREAMLAAGAEILTGPLSLTVCAYLAIPQSRLKKLKEGDWHCQRPDAENILKGIQDGMSKTVYGDDAVISKVRIEKRWSRTARTEIFIERLNEAGI